MKRLLALIVVFCFVFGSTACSPKGDSTENAATGENTAGNSSGNASANASGNASEDELAPIEFSIFYPDYNRRIPPDDAPIVQQVVDATGVSFKYVIPPAEPLERLNIMLATDDLTDLIVFHDATIMQQFVKAGKLLDLESLMKENAPQAYNVNYASFRDRIRNDDGKMYFLPGGYEFGDAADSLITLPETDTTFVARTGLLEELGWYNPSDFEAVFELLNICKERYPEMSPMALALGPQGHLWALNGIGAGAYGLIYEDSNVLLYDNEIKFFNDVPEMKEWYAFLNRIYRAGLMDVESPIMSQDMLKEKVVAGRVFSWFGPGWEIGSEFIGYMESIGSDEQCMWYLFPKANDSVQQATYARYTQGLYTTGLTLTTKNKDPERFFKFYEYINSEEGWFASHGVINWDFTGENTVENTEGYDFVVLNDQPNFRDGMKRIVASEWMGFSWNDDENWWWNRGLENFGSFKYGEGNHPLGKYDYVGDLDVGMWWDDNTKRIYGAYGLTGLNYFDKMLEVGCDNTLISGLTIEPESDEAIIKLTLDNYLETQLPRIIVAESESEFNALWDEMSAKLNTEGKEAFVAKKNELLQDRLSDWGMN